MGAIDQSKMAVAKRKREVLSLQAKKEQADARLL